VELSLPKKHKQIGSPTSGYVNFGLILSFLVRSKEEKITCPLHSVLTHVLNNFVPAKGMVQSLTLLQRSTKQTKNYVGTYESVLRNWVTLCKEERSLFLL
jgi:hypothetical protein